MPSTQGSLADRTMTTLREFFGRQNHHPSEEHYAALEDIARTMERMAHGTCEQKVFLSAVDPGIGKSQTVVHFMRQLVADPAWQGVGMMVCVGRIEEAKSFAADLGVPGEHLAVLTSNDEVNAIGGSPPDRAQVLITTQQRIEMLCDCRPLAAVSAFHYHGQPRQMRVWDEAWLPGGAVTLTPDDLALLAKPVRPVCSDLADALLGFAVSLKDVADSALVSVPDFALLYDVSLHEVLATTIHLQGRLRDDQQMAATALMVLNGRTAAVRKDGKTGSTILTYRETLPADLLPLLVLDASGRVRETYRHMEDHRDNLVRLREAVKDYAPLIVHTWQTSGSKSGFERDGDKLAEGIASVILSKPAERWLCVVHKASRKIGDVQAAIKRRLPGDVASNVETITWGNHMATNLYREVPNVILAGTLFMKASFYAALTHLAQDRSVERGLVSAADIDRTVRGEHANLLLQALCRGRVRRSNGSQCYPMDAYIIASPRSGIPRDLERIFPGCKVVAWNGSMKALTRHAARALEVVKAALNDGQTWITYRSIARTLGVEWSNFRKHVVRNEDWLEAVAKLGFTESEGEPRRAKGLRMVMKEGLREAA